MSNPTSIVRGLGNRSLPKPRTRRSGNPATPRDVPGCLSNGKRGNRTPDTRIFNQLLYQMSYLPQRYRLLKSITAPGVKLCTFFGDGRDHLCNSTPAVPPAFAVIIFLYNRPMTTTISSQQTVPIPGFWGTVMRRAFAPCREAGVYSVLVSARIFRLMSCAKSTLSELSFLAYRPLFFKKTPRAAIRASSNSMSLSWASATACRSRRKSSAGM